MGLINWKSKPEDLIKTVEEEFERARHWLKKSTSSKAVREQISRLAYNASITGEVQRLPNVVEYTSKAGNRWLCLITVDKDYNIFEGLMMYGLTESYMWSIQATTAVGLLAREKRRRWCLLPISSSACMSV